jgi:hypothetical protein
VRIQSKWIILQLTSLLCYTTLFPAIFSAVPLALFRLEAPRRTYYTFIISTNLILATYFGVIKTEGLFFALGYGVICFFGTVLAELLLKFYPMSQDIVYDNKTKFWNNYLGIGLAPLLLAVLGIFIYLNFYKADVSLYSVVKQFSTQILSETSTQELLKEIKKSPAPEAEQVISLLENPEAFTSQLLFALPSYFLVSYFVLAFFTVFFLSRLNHFTGRYIHPEWVKGVVYDYRNPDFFIVFAIIALAWSLFYQQLPLNEFWLKHAPILGSSLINVIGVFFFFQGLMVCLHLLDRWGIKGFFGAIIIFVILLLVIKAVAVLGLLDMWLDIRNKKFGFGNKTINK